MTDPAWIVYILENEHGALYTGITTSLARRLAAAQPTQRMAQVLRYWEAP